MKPHGSDFALASAVITIARMTERARNILCIRFFELELKLAALAEGRVVDGNPVEVEAAWIEEREAIALRLGVDLLDRRE